MPRLTRLAILYALCVCTPQPAGAQTAEPPRLEIGGQVSTQTGERGSATWTPRLTLNVRPDTAVEWSVDFRQPGDDPFPLRKSAQLAFTHVRQVLVEGRRWRLSGVVGAGVSRTTIDFPGSLAGSGGRFNGPNDARLVEWGPAVTIGPALQFDVAKRLSLRADLRFDIADSSGVRAMAGATVPFGQLPAGARARQRRPDGLGNGALAGTIAGAVTGLVGSTILVNLLCEGECTGSGAPFITLGTVTVGGMGGLLGAMIDAFRR